MSPRLQQTRPSQSRAAKAAARRAEKEGVGEGQGPEKQSVVPTPAAPPPAEASASPIAPVWRALMAAATGVSANWKQTAEHRAVSPADIRTTTSALCECVMQAMAGEPVTLRGFPPFVPTRRILDLMRTSFLALAQTPEFNAAPEDVLLVVRALDHVQIELDLDAAHRFASRLSGPDAQQLVVEMAHDMRSPLGSILILAERLRSGAGGALTPIQERQLGLVYSAAFGLSSLAGDVIELARGGTTLMDQPPMPFAVSEVLQSILDILRPMAEEKRLTMRCTGPEGDIRVGYQAALNRVLLNLATNAIKFTSEGSVEVIGRQIDRTRVEFSVRDTGRGIPDYVLSNLFEAFRQRQITGDYAFSSAGLGLSICKKLVAAMGSELMVDTELERGTRFLFTMELPQPSRL